jgi:hypothetical protein
VKVVVQAGHVARKTGSTGTNGEQPFNIAVSEMVVQVLRARHVNAHWIEADPSLDAYHGDFFVAIHADGSVKSSATGASVGYRNGRGKTFAHAIKAAYQQRAGDAGYELLFRDDNYTEDLHLYYGTGNALAQNPQTRAVIVEAGFLTSPKERKFLNSDAGREALALAIADSIKADDAPMGPRVNLDRLTTAFKLRQDDIQNDTEQVQRALNREYNLHLRTDGVVDEATVAAYRAHQERLFGKVGDAADGIPGRKSLEALGFEVT